MLNGVEYYFSNSIRVEKNNGYLIEFCPDNTCELYKASRAASFEQLVEFFYLYTYYFSQYYVLTKWRKEKESTEIARKILSKYRFAQCKSKIEIQDAKCIVKTLAGKNFIELYQVRNDEKERNLVKIDLEEAEK